MITRDIRTYLSRDWAAVRAAKDAYWAGRITRLGAMETLKTVFARSAFEDELLERVRLFEDVLARRGVASAFEAICYPK